MFASVQRLSIAAALVALAGCAAKAPPGPVSGPPPPPPRASAPPGYTGLSGPALMARFGAPAFSRKDGPTQMWRYDSGACRIFFFLTGAQVSHVETLPRGASDAADPACLAALKPAP